MEKLFRAATKEFDRAFNNVGTYAFADIPEPRWQPIYTMVPIAPLNKSGVTVCDLIRPSRAAMAAASDARFQPRGRCAEPTRLILAGISLLQSRVGSASALSDSWTV